MLNISWITERIAIAAAFVKEDIAEIKNKGFQVIVDLRSEYCDDQKLIEKSGLKFLNVKIDDRYSPDLKQLEKIFDFVLPLLNAGKKVLIHCQNGCGRSPLVAVALLVKQGMNLARAIAQVKDKHPAVGFTPQQERFVYSLEKLLQK